MNSKGKSNALNANFSLLVSLYFNSIKIAESGFWRHFERNYASFEFINLHFIEATHASTSSQSARRIPILANHVQNQT